LERISRTAETIIGHLESSGSQSTTVSGYVALLEYVYDREKVQSSTLSSNTIMSTTGEGRIVNVSQKGQATIPKELREKHGIEPGSRVRIRENDHGEIVVEPLPSLQDFRGAATTSERGTAILREERTVDEERSQRLERDR